MTADVGIMGTSDDFYKPENKQKIRETAEKIIAIEAPISEKLFMRKVFTAWGITRSGSRVESVFADAAQGVSPFATADENRVFLWKEGNPLKAILSIAQAMIPTSEAWRISPPRR